MSTHTKYSLLFFGTGQTSLDALQVLAKDFVIEAVITKPSKQFGQGIVQTWAEENQVAVYTPSNSSELSSLFNQTSFESTLGVVLDYGQIISQSVIDTFAQGIINSHFSLLPRYRGSNPIRAVILSGERATGVTIIKIVAELDAGPILTWAKIDIDPNETTTTLRAKLSELNCALLGETLRLYIQNELEPISQDDTAATFTHMTKKIDGAIDINKSVTELEREIRAYSGWPKSSLQYKGQVIIVLQAEIAQTKIAQGQLSFQNNELLLGCEDGSLSIIKLQLPGKRPIYAKSFVNGYGQLLN